MLGHKLVQTFLPFTDVWASATDNGSDLIDISGLAPDRVIPHFDALDDADLALAFEKSTPQVVINAIGLVKQSSLMSHRELVIALNSLLPHRLASASEDMGFRLIHISTDCVFLGTKGKYVEEDVPDAVDLYGRSKLLGETTLPGALVLRTSLIGHELRHHLGLLEWFLSQGRPVTGFSQAVFSGLPTITLAKVILDSVGKHPTLAGVFNVASERISKFVLLNLINDKYGSRKIIVKAIEPTIDRSLDQTNFHRATQVSFPPWPELIANMHADAVSCGQWGPA